jgi:glycosyltransferase involved in cell wall biosynthesis
MTAYNRQAFIAQAIASVKAQTYPDWELIIWDDGSTDLSPQIASNYQKQDPRITLISSHHQGRVQSLKAAHALAQGEYLGWIDSDDLLHPTVLELTCQILDNRPNIGLVYTNYLTINPQGKVLGAGKRCTIPYSRDRLLVDFMTFHFRLLRRQVWEVAGGIDTSLPLAIDYDLCLRISEVTEICHLPQPLYYYRYHQNSLSVAHRLPQIHAAAEAIRRALVRRHLNDSYELRVEVSPHSARYALHRRAIASKPQSF